jgi:predicted transcriptional regulator
VVCLTNEKAQTFTTTEKGLRFLKIYNEIKTILATVEEEEEEEEEHINN